MKLKMKKRVSLWLLMMLLIQSTFAVTSFAAAETTLPVTWNLNLMYADEAAFESGLKYVSETAVSEMKAFKGKLSDDATLLSALKLYEKASIESTKLTVYASMLQDTDSTNTTYTEFNSKATAASSAFQNACAFLQEEVLKRDDANITALTQKPEFKKFIGLLEGMIQARSTSLSEESESIMAQFSPIATMPEEIYTQMTLSDAKYGEFTNHLGETYTFDPDYDTAYLYSNDSKMRARAFEALYSPYKLMENSLASTYITEVKKNAFYANVYGYESSLAYALSGTIEPETYKALIKASRENVSVYQNYLKMKKEALGFSTLKTSDLLLSYGTEFSKSYPYEEAVSMVKEALQPLGKTYSAMLNDYFTKGYIDVYPAEFKTTSQYSWGAYGSPTYVLLNYNESLNDVSTVAHELGHAMHQEYINKKQTFFDTNMTPFPAEVTSTFNELMFMDYLNQETKSPEEKLAYTQHELDFFIQTFFEQVILADFEMQVYEQVDAGEALTLESLNQLFLDTLKIYYGDVVEIEPFYATYWMSIPHLYQNHYVYSYSLSLAVSQKIKELVDNKEKDIISKYENFLSLGSSLSPTESLATLGIDINDGKFYDAIFNRMSTLTQSVKEQLGTPDLVLEYPPTLLSLEEIEAYNAYEKASALSTEDSTLYLVIFFIFIVVIILIINVIVFSLVSRAKYKNMALKLTKENKELKEKLLSQESMYY